MIVTVKNLLCETFTIDIDGEETVLQLKERIHLEHGEEYIVEKQRLIYTGIILNDERSIASYNIDDQKFVIVILKRDIDSSNDGKPNDLNDTVHSDVMQCRGDGKEINEHEQIQKLLSAFNEATGNAEVLSTKMVLPCCSCEVARGGDATEGSDGMDLRIVGSNSSLQSNASGESMLSTSSTGSDNSESSHTTYSSDDLAGVFSNISIQSTVESNWLTGDEYNRSIESMVEMGYRRELAERAMAASFNNPERAVEYLLSGIPEINEEAFIVQSTHAIINTSHNNNNNACDAADTNATDDEEGATAAIDAVSSDDSVQGTASVIDAIHSVTRSTATNASFNPIGDNVHVQEQPAEVNVAAGGEELDVPVNAGGNNAAGGDGNVLAANDVNVDGGGGANAERPHIAAVLGAGDNAAAGGGDGNAAGGDGDVAGGAVDNAAVGGGGGGDVIEGRHGADPFVFLRNQPQFLQMRSLVYQNPDLLQAVLQQIGQTNAPLLRLISDNQEAFLNMLNQPVPGPEGNLQLPRRMTPGRARQIIELVRIAAGGDGAHVQPTDTAPGASGDGPPIVSPDTNQPTEGSGDATAGRVAAVGTPAAAESLSPIEQVPNWQSIAAERAAAYMRDRAAAAATVAALSRGASAAVPESAQLRNNLTDAPRAAAPNASNNNHDEQNNRNMSAETAANTNGGIRVARRQRMAEMDAAANYVQPAVQYPQHHQYQPFSRRMYSNGTMNNGHHNGNGGLAPPRYIRLSPIDRAAINRLIAMGFPEHLVIEAYFVCDKNEEMTVDYLVAVLNN